MKIGWGEMATIFLALVLASMVEHKFLKGNSTAETTPKTSEPTVVYANPVEQFVASRYPDATTI